MAQDVEKAENRLQNIQAVSPILGALRTISLGNWQMAINKRNNILRYNNQLLELVPYILPDVSKQLTGLKKRKTHKKTQIIKKVLLVGIGTERGLCGRYNAVLAEYLISLLSEYRESENQVTLGILGTKLLRAVERHDTVADWSQKMPVNNLPSFHLANVYVSTWLKIYEKGEIDRIMVVYNRQERAGKYKPTETQLIPTRLPETQMKEHWPPYIVETDPVQLYTQIVMQWTAIQLHNLMLEAAITEHGARFQLMESASQNADRLSEELTISIQSIRRQRITREIQELAVGAGLIG
jgi:F-type H+-transporting ATPase subunit gamma